MTIDEELNVLDDALRRLKVEYDIFFGGGSKKAPADTEWRVKSLLKKHSDGGSLNHAQRFRYNSMAQKYAIFSDLWRQKLKIKEEGYRRPQDAVLGIQGLRPQVAETPVDSETEKPFSVRCNGPTVDPELVRSLYAAMLHARAAAGESAPAGSYEAFSTFVHKKAEMLRKEMDCNTVEFSVEFANGRVKLKAKPLK